MSRTPEREAPAWQLALSEALSEALPRLLETSATPPLQELIAALTGALCRGEIELDLSADAPPEVTAALWPQDHLRALADSGLCREPDGPMRLSGKRLAWHRWLDRRQQVVAALLQRVGSLRPDQGVDHGPPSRLDGLDPQQRSAVLALQSQGLVLLLGGPGTGKTSTIARMLEALLQRRPAARIHLAAPTGKAAARLRAATGAAYPCTTVHRLLGSRGDGFGRGPQQPLALDLLVIDEVSMVDLELMGAVLEALPSDCQLVLVGDPAQLPPIAPGPLLAALDQADVSASLAPARIELRSTYRNDGAIAQVAACLRHAISKPDNSTPISEPAVAPWQSLQPLLQQLHPEDNLQWQPAPRKELPATALQRLRQHQRELARLAAGCWPDTDQGWRELLSERDRLLVLSPVRRGRWGIDTLHRTLLGPAAASENNALAGFPSGTPLLCRRNLPELGLANGDIGLLVVRDDEDPAVSPQRRLLFGQEEPLWFHPAQLAAALEPALALTVHKAQGSEAAELIVLLEDPDKVEPRLLYTALTRARRQALLITAEASG